MKKPAMIIFDAGKTLIDYLPKDAVRGRESLMAYLSTIDATRIWMRYVVSNPKHYDAETVDRRTNQIFEQYEPCRKALFEVHEQTILKTVLDLLELRLSIPIAEVERIIWNHSARVLPVDGARELLGALNETGIRTAVISNLDFSGYLLEEKLKEIYPNNRFEFVIASSDYGIRKPQRLLFEVGIAQSRLAPEEIWYVGDKVKVDVMGSQAVGMTPVLYQSKRNTYASLPDGLLAVKDYQELTDIIRRLR